MNLSCLFGHNYVETKAVLVNVAEANSSTWKYVAYKINKYCTVCLKTIQVERISRCDGEFALVRDIRIQVPQKVIIQKNGHDTTLLENELKQAGIEYV